jgi:hypothetical protein
MCRSDGLSLLTLAVCQSKTGAGQPTAGNTGQPLARRRCQGSGSGQGVPPVPAPGDRRPARGQVPVAHHPRGSGTIRGMSMRALSAHDGGA